jgi:hypothetical protein
MITSVEYHKYETWEVDLWDHVLDHILSDETKKLILNMGIEAVSKELSKGGESRFIIQKCDIRCGGGIL